MKYKEGILEARVARAKASIKPCFYVLGRGGFNPIYPNDATWDKRRSDCSGFISHVLMTKREPKHSRPFWIETTAIYKNATGSKTTFTQVQIPVPGCMVVYGDSRGKQGHCGIVSDVHYVGPIWVGYDTIECASGIQGKLGKAIRIRKDAQHLFEPRGAIFCVLTQDIA